MIWDEQVGDAQDVRWVFETMPIMLAALRGPDHRIVALNAAYRALIPKADATGRPVREVFPEVLGQFVFDVFDRVYLTGEPFAAVEWRVHADFDGSGQSRDLFFDFTAAARRDASGVVDGVNVVLRDASTRVSAREAAEIRLAGIMERYEQARASATVMQQALLAPSVPVLPGADVAAEYLVAAKDTAAGGDWFDAIATGDGALVLAVGDVVGHGVEAAAVMAQLRTAVRVEVHRGAGVGDVLAAVNGFSTLVPGSKFATVCLARLDTGSGTVEYATAGHPPPLLIAGAGPRFFEPTGGMPLGGRDTYTTKTETLEIGDAILLYTDGIIERPGRPAPASTAELASVATAVLAGHAIPDPDRRPIDRLCSQTLELLLRTTGYSDDVTLLAAQRTTTPPPVMHLRVAAERTSTRIARTELRIWLTEIGADETDTVIVEHAISEYVQNAADHAYTNTGGVVEVDAALAKDGTVHATVVDHGTWKPSVGPESSRGGLTLISTLLPTSRVTHDEDGTRAELTYRLTRPARIVTDPTIAPAAPPVPYDTEFDINVDADGVLTVTGDIDAVHSPILAGRIAGQSRSATTPLSVDLSAATHLGSSALRVLADASALADTQNTQLTLIAPPGSTAHHVLTLVGLPAAVARSD